MAFRFTKNFSPKEKFNCEECHSRDFNSLGEPRILLGHFPVAYSSGQIFSDQIVPWCIPLLGDCRCGTRGSSGHTCIDGCYALGWG